MPNFQTTLRLARQPNGLYALHATTVSPDSCYVAARAMRGSAFSHAVPPDSIGVLLPVVKREPSTGMPVTLRHTLPNLRLCPGDKVGVAAFLVSNPDRGVLGAATIRLVRNRAGRLVPVQTVSTF